MKPVYLALTKGFGTEKVKLEWKFPVNKNFPVQKIGEFIQTSKASDEFNLNLHNKPVTLIPHIRLQI